MKKAFTLVEMITVLVVLSIIILIITPVMLDLMLDFEEKSNKQVYEQLYKASELYYAEKRSDRLVSFSAADFWHGDAGALLTPLNTTTLKTFVGSDDYQTLYEKTWEENTELPSPLYWSCLNAQDLNEQGYLKSQTLTEVKKRLEVNPNDLAIIMISTDDGSANRIVIKEKALWIGSCP